MCFETSDNTDLSNWLDRGYLLESGILYRLHPDLESNEPQLVHLEIFKLFRSDPTAEHIGIEATIKKNYC